MNVAVIGGGYAGMAAAVTLAGRAVPVTIFEAGPHLGGRARRVSYNDTTLDNGLHILVGAYRETLRLVALVNADPGSLLLRFPLDWRIHPDFRLRARPLPAPLHLLSALLLARGPSLGARLAAARFVRHLRARNFRLSRDVSVTQLLRDCGQDEKLVRLLWRPLCIAALNTPPDEASAQIFVNVLRNTFDGDRGDSDIVLARTDLTTLFPAPAGAYVEARGGTTLPGHAVDAITRDGAAFQLESRGERHRFTHVICALPPHRLRPAIGQLTELAATAAIVERFRFQPIYSVYLQYPGRISLPAPMVGLADGIAHWLFDRETICGQRGLVAAVISAEGSHQDMIQDELAQRVHETVARYFGPVPAPLWWRVIAEKRATFACTVGLVRPAHRTALPGFYLAGDYTAGDYPATIEAAVRSGIACANAVLGSGEMA